MELIGRGGSSKVFKIMEIEYGKLFALKKVKLCKQEPTVSDGYLNEIELLRKLKGNKHIIQLEDYVVSLDSILLVIYFNFNPRY
jgi:serine/threonine-protein kinase TTK/MPS1